MVRVSEKFLRQITELAKDGASLVNAFSSRIINLDDPVNPQDAVTKAYVDNLSLSIGQQQETVQVVSNGQTSFTISSAPISDGYVQMYVNGVKQHHGVEYTQTGTSITYIVTATSPALVTDDVVEFWYLADIIGADPAPTISVSLAEVLEVGNTSDGYDIILTEGSVISSSDGDVTVDDNLVVTGKLTVTGLIDPTGLVLNEQATDPASTSAGEGTLWVRNDSPNVLIFTDDAGTDHQIGPSVIEITESTDSIITVTDGDGPTVDLSTPNLRVTASNGVAFGPGTPSNPSTTISGVFLGNLAGGAVTGGSNNVAIGLSAMNAAISGSSNVAIGNGTLSSTAVGDNNVGLGFGVTASAPAGSVNNSIGIGQTLSLSNSNQVIIGNSPLIPTQDDVININNVFCGHGTSSLGTGKGSINAASHVESGWADEGLNDQLSVFGIYSDSVGYTDESPMMEMHGGGVISYFYQGDYNPDGTLNATQGSVFYRIGSGQAIYQNNDGYDGWTVIGSGAGGDGYQSLENVLDIGNTTGGYDIDLTEGSVITSSDGYVTVDDDLIVTGKLTVAGLIDPTGLVLNEQSSDPASTSAGEGTIWVRDDTPNALMFTDDEGTDHEVGYKYKYTVGPSWSGAEYTTIQDAVDAAADEHPDIQYGGVVFSLYPQFYSEDVVVPSTLANFHFTGTGSGVGSFIQSLTCNLPQVRPQTMSFSFSKIGFSALSVLRPLSDGGVANMRMEYCELYGPCTIDALNLSCEIDTSRYQNALLDFNGSFLGVFNSQFRGNSSGDVRISSTATSQTRIIGCQIGGRITFAGLGCILFQSHVEHNGSPAVADGCTSVSFCMGNVFAHNAGPSGPVWVKTGTSNFHDGGNSFAEGQVYPWYDVQSGTRSDRAESDTQLRNVFEVSGSPALTAAQVGGQRKTTVAKTDGGGTITLPPIEDIEPGCTIIIKDFNGNATASAITIDGYDVETIDGASNISLSTNFQSVELQAGSTDWIVINKSRLIAPDVSEDGYIATALNGDLIYSLPNDLIFQDDVNGNISLKAAPTDIAEDENLADSETIVLDYTPPESSFCRITFLVNLDGYAFDHLVVANRDGSNPPDMRVDKILLDENDYTDAPACTHVASVNGNNIRMSVTNNDAVDRYCKIAVSSVEDLF